MHIGIDLTAIWRRETGVITVPIEIATRLLRIDTRNQYTLFFSKEIHPAFRELRGTFEPVISPFRHEVLCKNLWLPLLPQIRQLDYLHFFAFPPPWFCPCPHGWTFHDATAWLCPETMTKKSVLYTRLLGRRAVRTSQVLLTPTEAAAHDLIKYFPAAAGKIRVVSLGVRSVFTQPADEQRLEDIRRKYNLPPDFVLFVGTLEPRKNLAGALEAFAILKKRGHFSPSLVIVGRKGWLSAPIFADLAKSGLQDHIVLTGFVPDEDLAAIYRLARFLILVSFYEGFGLPPLEAMACGCPTLVSNRGALREVTGDAACHVNPESVDEIAEGMQRLYDDAALRAQLAQRGLERAGRFSWDRAAEQVADIFQEFAGRRSQSRAQSSRLS
jgi:glycosyltransferase involved in cell wall biosynthesis